MNIKRIETELDQFKRRIHDEVNESISAFKKDMLKYQVPEDKQDRPNNQDLYFFVDYEGDTMNTFWTNRTEDEWRLSQGNCFWGEGPEQICTEYKKL